ncbi:hypothetical protein [endosymbiont GvMRE of Glomus versiforme]|uniref:hypothetical protein n=1 Tax=endosymbiont GvMRE of Glomus versiforme TaxID=2039283 RepID=UPI0011C42D0F|nr:hypothetical protein [endosymbiont GvMRE of Glomus versiforme]
MTNKRHEYIYQFYGTIHSKTLTKPSPTSKYAGQEYYRLKIIQSDQTKKTIQVFKEKLANSTIWEAIQQRQYSKKPLIFFCRNVRGYYYLVNWEEIPQQEKEVNH